MALALPARAQSDAHLLKNGVEVFVAPSITEVLGSGLVAPGDVIQLKTAYDASGNPIAFTEASGETFPIPIPSGVTLQAVSGTRAYVGITEPGSGDVVFTVGAIGAGSPLTEETTFEDLVIAGGGTAIAVTRLPGEQTNLVLRNVRFGRNETALSCEARASTSQGGGGQLRGVITVIAEDCWIADEVAFSAPTPPLPRSFSRGFSFRAIGDDGGEVTATVSNLRVYGEFPQARMKPIGVLGDGVHDLEPFAPSSTGGSSPELTRILEVYASNTNQQTEGEHEAPPSYAVIPDGVPMVDLTIQGGNLHGRSTSPQFGWDVGLYADADGQYFVPRPLDYMAIWRVTASGTVIRNLRAAGIYARNWTETRGWLDLFNVNVREVGKGYPVPEPMLLRDVHSGVHLVVDEAYQVFRARNCEFDDNQSNGVYAHSHHSIQSPDMELPTGLYVVMDHCGMHGNLANGLFLDAAPNKVSYYPSVQGAIVGGTMDFATAQGQTGIPSLLVDGTEPDPDLPSGQGVIDGCAISNNGRGVTVRALGTHLAPSFDFSAASIRFVNTYVWNNSQGGFLARLDALPGQAETPLLLTPWVHSTLAWNHTDAANGWTADVALNSGLQGVPPAPLFYWDDGAASPGRAILITSFDNSIFQRPNPTDDDFTAELAALLVEDPNSGPPYYCGIPAAIGWSGLRARDITLSGLPRMFTDSASPFLGPVDPASRSLEQWFIDNQAGVTEFYITPYWLNAGAALSEDDNDIEGVPRPSVVSGLRDKGGEED